MRIEKPMTENQKFYGNKLYKFLLHNGTVTKAEMLNHLGWDKKKDRQLRGLLSLIGQKAPLISVSNDEGYRLARTKEDLPLVEHAWAELYSRTEVLNRRMKPLIEFRDKIKFNIN